MFYALLYVNIDQGIHKVKMKVAQIKKRKKLLGISFYINIVNFEAFLWNLNLSTNRFFWRCVYLDNNLNCFSKYYLVNNGTFKM